ncbi:MAG: amidohydrolase [Anaerovoracaceae bacterium]|jgi:5-methylthioadenosine/S-adenosylhomocysteine deaminase
MLFKNITILDENLDVKENMYVATKDDRIDYIGKTMPPSYTGDVYDGKDRLLMTGFINAHAHSAMTLMRGYGENMVLQDWLGKRIFPFEAKLTSKAVYWGTLLAMAESLRFGIVSSSDMYFFIPDIARAVIDSGAKNNISNAVVLKEGVAFEDMPEIKELSVAKKVFDGCENGRIKIDSSLHAEYTTNEEIARKLADLTRDLGLNMQVHVAETKKETEECKERHGGRTPVKYLADCGIFDTNTTAAHCVWLEDEDYDILRDKKVTVATNPCSNLKLASGICDSAKLLDRGINLAIGTDSVASNNSLNFIEEIKVLALGAKVRANDPTVITPKQALYAATKGGAIAQGRDDCGALKVGNRADLIMLRTDVPNMHPIHNALNNIVYSASGSDIVMTMVDGKVLYENGEYKTIDIDKAVYETENATKEILSQL